MAATLPMAQKSLPGKTYYPDVQCYLDTFVASIPTWRLQFSETAVGTGGSPSCPNRLDSPVVAATLPTAQKSLPGNKDLLP